MTEWIKCSDRMPEEGREVLACLVAGYSDPRARQMSFEGRVWCSGACDYDVDEVTHWMPLPSPPEVE